MTQGLAGEEQEQQHGDFQRSGEWGGRLGSYQGEVTSDLHRLCWLILATRCPSYVRMGNN